MNKRTEPKYDVGDTVTAQPGKWANKRYPVKARILGRGWSEERRVWEYRIETIPNGNQGTFDELHILGKD